MIKNKSFHHRLLAIVILVLSLLLAWQLMPDALANSLEEGGSGLAIPSGEAEINEGIVQNRTFGELIILVVNYFIGFLGIIATVMFIYAGVLWVVAAGNEELIGKSKKIMIYSSLGIVVILMSYAAVRFLTNISGAVEGPNGQGEGNEQAFQCDVTSDCSAGQYCFAGQCNESSKVACQDDAQCGGGQCSPLGFCYDPNSGSGFSCQDDSECNLGFVCNLGVDQCELSGLNQGGGILGGDSQAQSDQALESVDALIDIMEGEANAINDNINGLPDGVKQEVISALDNGFIGSKKSEIQALIEQTNDPDILNVLERILTYLERLEDLRGEIDDLREAMPESVETIAAYDEASLSLDEAMEDPRSNIKFSRFQQDYTSLKTLIRQFPVVESVIRATPGEGNVPFTVTLNGLDSIDPTGGTISEYKWSFLDSGGDLISLGSDPVVVHTFTEPNTYSVRLEVTTSQTDESGYKMAMDGVSVVRIKANPPTSNVEFKVDGKEVIDVYHVTLEEAQTGLSFDPTETTPAFGRTIEKYEWLFGDGATEVRSTPSTVVHSYQEAGEYLVTLKIRDNAGVEDRRVVKLILKPVASDAQISPLQGDVNTQFEFKGSGSRSDNGSINQYEWEISDEENNTVASFQEPEVRYQFEQPGTYQVTLTVTDTSNQSDRSVRELTVLSREPVANFTHQTPESNHPNTIAFDASTSYDPDPGDSLTYSWDFDGDGGFEVVDSKEVFASHTYRQVGSYNTVLQVQDRFGERHQIEEVITIDSILGGDIVLDKRSFRVGEEVNFEADSPGAVAYLWEFGDGQTLNSEEEEIVTHAYSEKGKYKVTLHFFDRSDESNTHTLTVLVGDQDVPLALASATVNQYTPTLTPDACAEGQPAMIISRDDRVMFSAADSVNTDGSSRLLDYTWELSEGIQNTSRDFSYRFTQLTPGNDCATATLRVRDQLSGKVSETDTLYFKVVNKLPTLSDFVVEAASEELVTPTKVNLKVVSPVDLDGQVKQYRWWYFLEGNEQEKLGVHSTTTPETQMIITAQGQPGVENRYTFVVEMLDNDNGLFNSLENYGEVSQLDIVNGPNLSPVAEFTVDKTTIAVGDTITFVSKSYDPQGDPLPDDAFRWDFDGDGSYDDTTSGPQVNHPYNTPGQYNARLNVNYRGLSSTVTHTVNVEATNAFPQAAFLYTVEGTNVDFNAMNSRANATFQEAPLTYEWDFDIQQDADGNGVPDDDVQSTEIAPSFTYPQTGLYSARLKVTDDSGAQGVVVRSINLNLTQQEWEQNRYRSLEISAINRPMTQLLLSAVPLNMQIGESAELTAKVENADLTPYKGNVFFEIIEGSGELTPNPALGSSARDSQATSIFTATAPGPVRLRVKAAGTFHGDVIDEMVLNVN